MKRAVCILMLLNGLLAEAAVSSAPAKGAESPKPMSLADARSQIDAIVSEKHQIGRVITRLADVDQTALLGEVNKAISAMPASVEEKSAKFLKINSAALRAAKGGGNVSKLMAEVFATVTPEALTVINERFAVDLVNRAANPKVTYTDAQYTKLAVDLMKVINARTEEADNGSARSAFAILMLVRASNGTPEDLIDKLVETLNHQDARDMAKNEWILPALGKDGRDLGYEPILASADAGRRPDFQFVLVIAGPQYLDSILEDIVGKNSDRMSFMRTRTPVLDAVENPLIHQIPTLHDDPFGNNVGPTSGPEKPSEPQYYEGQG